MLEKFKAFVSSVLKKGVQRLLPKPSVKGWMQTRTRRNARVAIMEATRRNVTCLLIYKKATSGQTNRYEVIPTEYKCKRDKQGRMRMLLYVQDVRERGQIKGFYVRNILKGVPTSRKAAPRWPVLIPVESE